VSSGSGSGAGADQHLLALLRAIRLRQAAPDAVAAGIADTAAALTRLDELNRQVEKDSAEGQPGDQPGPAASSPAAEKPAAEKRAAEKPAAEKPAAEKPAAEKPAADKSARPWPGWTGPPSTERPGAHRGLGQPGRAEHKPGATAGSSGFFEHGPQLRPPALLPVDPTTSADTPVGDEATREPGPALIGEIQTAGAKPPADLAERADQSKPHATAGAGDPGGPGDPGDPGGFGDGVGRPSRNRFGGLTPTRRGQPAATPPPPPPAEEPDPAAGRPRWASGEHEIHARTTPRVPVNDAQIAPPMVAAPGGAGVDGMDPADDALLRETQRLLSTSLTFAGGPHDVADRFREALLRAHPGMMAKLPGDARTQVDLLASGLTWLVHHLDQPPLVVAGCGRLGAALAACGVRAAQLQLVGAALAEAMRTGMPPGVWRQDFDLAWRSTWQHVYEWIQHGEATAGYEPAIWTAEVVSHELRRPDLAVVRLRPLLPMPFRPGQFARVEVPERPGIWRPYSLAGAPRRDNVVELHVRAKTHNGVSGTLVYRTRVGDRLRLSRAEGDMGLPAEAGRSLLMIAGDTGVAPLKALLTELRDTADSRSAVLFWGVRALTELYDIADVNAIARAAKRVTVVPVISEGDPGPYASGLVTDAVAAYGEWSDHEVYLAGPPLMLAATSAALQQLGVAPGRIHHDAPQ
jgi:NAD(P)H-flavin reductase